MSSVPAPEPASPEPASPEPASPGSTARPADTPTDQILSSLKLNGVDRIWFVSGSEIGVLQEGSAKHRALGLPTPQIMTMTHENAALAAACGETVVTGRPSAAAFHVEVGLLNAGGAIHNADRGRHPVLLMSGYPASAEPGTVAGARDGRIQWYQQVRDQGEIVRQYMRWDHKLTPYDNAGAVITRALQTMLSEPQGPAYLALPREVAMGAAANAGFPLLDRLPPVPSPFPDPAQLQLAAQWLLAADEPVISVSRIGRQPEALRSLVKLAELLGARVLADTHHGLAFPGSHPLLRGVPGNAPLPDGADCVLAVDALVPWLPGQSGAAEPARVIHIAKDPLQRMTTTYQVPSDLSILADPGDAIPVLLDAVRCQLTGTREAEIAQRRDRHTADGRRRRQALIRQAEQDGGSGIISPLYLSYRLGQTAADALIAQELVEPALFDRTEPGTLAGPGGSSIGFVAPMAIGMKAAAPGRPVIAAVGDGSWMFANPQVCMWASAFHRAPVLFVVFNNRGYRTGTQEVLRTFPDGYAKRASDLTGGWFDPTPQFAAEAAASGHFGEKVTEPGELEAAIKRGLAAADGGTPGVLEVWLPKLVTGEV
jgi:acetolactate synthase-1/2/3 large subunit